MLLLQVSFNDSHPMGNYFYVYLYNKKKIHKLYKLLSKHKILNILITTMVMDNILEGLILPKKYIEENT
jgi:hypothetical protein